MNPKKSAAARNMSGYCVISDISKGCQSTFSPNISGKHALTLLPRMVFTRVLTLNELPRMAYYGYLVLYNLVYVLPLLAIVLAFTLTLGASKLTERQGRVLKLLSGLMMLGFGRVMLVAPDRLSSLWTGVVLLTGALALTAVAARLTRTQ